jgi:hypothetical protein
MKSSVKEDFNQDYLQLIMIIITILHSKQFIMCIVCHLSRDRHVEFIVFPDNSANILL